MGPPAVPTCVPGRHTPDVPESGASLISRRDGAARQPGARAAGPASRLCLPQSCGLSEAPATLSPGCLIQRTGTTASVCRASLSASLPLVGRRGQITTANTPPIFSSARASGRRDQPRPTSSHQVFHNQANNRTGLCGTTWFGGQLPSVPGNPSLHRLPFHPQTPADLHLHLGLGSG